MSTTVDTMEPGSEENLHARIRKKLETLSVIKFAAYRVASKLRILQRYLKLTYVDYNVLVRAFNTHQLQFGLENQEISYDNAQKVLTAIYQLISSYHFNESSIEETVDTFLTFICDILNVKPKDDLDLNGFKIILFALSNAKLPEKYRCFFRQITSPNVIASQVKLTELLEILLKLPNYLDSVESFHTDNIPACVQSCLDHTHDGVIREDIFVNWMSREPQTLVWLPTLHRLIATETVRHEAQCNNCKVYPVIGMRYRCLRCFNYDLCQTCFFTGDYDDKHDGTHPIEEYCKQVTPFEDLKAFLEFFKLKVGKNEIRRKERYLTIERSKSFSDASLSQSNRWMTSAHQSLNRAEIQAKKASHGDIYRPMPKAETQEFISLTDPKDNRIPLTGYDNVPKDEQDEKKKTTNKKKKVVQDSSFINDDRSKRTTYVNVEDKALSTRQDIHHADDSDEPPMLMPKQHKPMKKLSSIKKRAEPEHYQSPPKDKAEDDEDDDDYRPPLPPKQRHQQNTSRALVYDFIGNELQELRATLAQFDQTATTV